MKTLFSLILYWYNAGFLAEPYFGCVLLTTGHGQVPLLILELIASVKEKHKILFIKTEEEVVIDNWYLLCSSQITKLIIPYQKKPPKTHTWSWFTDLRDIQILWLISIKELTGITLSRTLKMKRKKLGHFEQLAISNKPFSSSLAVLQKKPYHLLYSLTQLLPNFTTHCSIYLSSFASMSELRLLRHPVFTSVAVSLEQQSVLLASTAIQYSTCELSETQIAANINIHWLVVSLVCLWTIYKVVQ